MNVVDCYAAGRLNGVAQGASRPAGRGGGGRVGEPEITTGSRSGARTMSSTTDALTLLRMVSGAQAAR